MNKRSFTDSLLLAGFCGFLFFFGLSFFGLVGADEPRYAQVAREMLARHDWITPTLGNVPWLEKPILYYWQAMLAYSVFGVSDWAARLPSAVDATLMVIAVYSFLRRFRAGLELDAGLIVASAAGVIGFARAASMDMPLAAAFTVAMLAWYAWYESRSKYYLAAFYVLLAIGTLAKGPIAPFLAAVIIVLFAWAKGELRLIKQTLSVTGILLFCVVALPWFVAVQIKNPEFFRVFVLEHNLSRFGTARYHHTQPFWYYIPVVLVAMLPWTVFVVTALVGSIRVWWSRKREMLQGEEAFTVFLLIWFVVPLIFFSISQSKLPGYILPVLPAGAILLADYVRRDSTSNLALTVIHGLLAGSLIVPAMLVQDIMLQHHFPWGRPTLIFSGFGAALAAGIILTVRLQPGLRVLRFVTLIPIVLAVGAVLRFQAPALDAYLSARPLAEQIGSMENGTLPTAVFRASREVEYGLHFYRNQSIARYELNQVPEGEHILIAPHDAYAGIASKVSGRRVSYLGTYAPTNMDYFWVAPVGMGHTMNH